MVLWTIPGGVARLQTHGKHPFRRFVFLWRMNTSQRDIVLKAIIAGSWHCRNFSHNLVVNPHRFTSFSIFRTWCFRRSPSLVILPLLQWNTVGIIISGWHCVGSRIGGGQSENVWPRSNHVEALTIWRRVILTSTSIDMQRVVAPCLQSSIRRNTSPSLIVGYCKMNILVDELWWAIKKLKVSTNDFESWLTKKQYLM